MENSSSVPEPTVEHLKRFSYSDLESFTNDFDTKIGSGGFGSVYRGKFPNGMQIAVKMLNEHVAERLFMEEVRIMGITYHHNLVRFLGYCSDNNKKGILYEYMENGSLYQILHTKDRCIEWEKLYDIMIETANGISYLHGKRIIHHDVKPANILLDLDFSPKVADFGLAKLINGDASHVTVSQAKGTRGYVAPEMIVEPFSHVTHKCDVYSFGMMLFDVLGRCNFHQNKKSFVEIVWEGFRERRLDKIIEDFGIEKKHKERAKILSIVALWCAQFTPRTRPEMRDVVKMLKREIQVMNPPNPLLPSQGFTTQSSGVMQEPEDVITWGAETSNNLARYDFVSIAERDEIIIKYVMQDHGFSNGIPVAAILMYRWCAQLYGEGLRHKTDIVYLQRDLNAKLDRLVRMIDSAIELQYDHVPYWLSTTSTLIFLLKCGFVDKMSFFRSRIPISVFNIVVNVQHVDSSHPALVFKANLINCVGRACGIIGDKLKEDLRSSLSLCIQAPTTASWKADWKDAVTFSANNSHWKSIIRTLRGILKKFQDNHVPPVLTSKVFSGAFHNINVQLFNSIMINSECCTLSYGEYLKVGLNKLDDWCDTAEHYVGSSSDQLWHTRQAVEFLVTINKSEITIDDITESLCPGLNAPQLHRICSVYNENHTHGVSSNVLTIIGLLWEDSPLLLEDSYEFQFFTDDMFSSLGNMDFRCATLEDVDIVKHPKYSFLKL